MRDVEIKETPGRSQEIIFRTPSLCDALESLSYILKAGPKYIFWVGGTIKR